MAILTPNEISAALQATHNYFANEVSEHTFDGEYNFLECQQDLQFVQRIARSFGLNQDAVDTLVSHEYPVDISLEDGGLTDLDGNLLDNQTKGWIDIRISSGEGAIWELKSPNNPNGNEMLLTQQNREQLIRYWQNLPVPRPRYMVLTNFRRFEIFDSNQACDYNTPPTHKFSLSEIGENADKFPYFNIENPNQVILETQEEVSDNVAGILAALYHQLCQNLNDMDRAVRFTTQAALLMYLEDLRAHDGTPILPRHATGRGPFLQLLREARENQDLAPLVFTMMAELGTPNEGAVYNLPYASEFWFGVEHTQPFELSSEYIDLLHQCASRNWRAINPLMFGAFIEQCYTAEERIGQGIHFTREADVMRIVEPLIVEHFQERIDAISEIPAAHHRRRSEACRELLDYLHNFRVLEPACGCANFLYITYRELKRVEDEIFRIMGSLPGEDGHIPLFRLTPRGLIGYEIQSWSAWVARMVMAIAYCENQLEFGYPALPLDSDGNAAEIINCDALLDGENIREWHHAHVIIGNPPFSGATLMRRRNPGYVPRLHAAFEAEELLPRRDIDLVGYWFLLAQRALTEGNTCAFGLISTRAIVQSQSRVVLRQALDNDLRIGVAHRWRNWVGDAGVSIAITCMDTGGDNRHINGTRIARDIDSDLVLTEDEINEYLLDWDIDLMYTRITGQQNYVRQGIKGPFAGRGGDLRCLILSDEEAQEMLAADNGVGGPDNTDVVVPFLANSYFKRRETKWIIYFHDYDEVTAATYLAPYTHLHDNGRRERVILSCTPEIIDPDNPGQMIPNPAYSAEYHNGNFHEEWWQVWRERTDVWNTVQAAGDTYFVKHQLLNHPSSEHIHLEQVPVGTIADGGVYILTLPHRWMIGVLLSEIHQLWCDITAGHTTTGGYTWRPQDVLHGFPFPQNPTADQITTLENAMDNYYQRIDQLFALEDYDTLGDVLDAAPLNIQRNAINSAVKDMYGIEQDAQITLQQLVDFKVGQIAEYE